jgi:ribonuclease HI
MKNIVIYTDGGSKGNPGPAGIGAVFCNQKGQVIKKYSEYLGKTTNNVAEYKAVIFALKKFKALFGKKLAKSTEVEIKTDSELLTKQLNGKYKIKDPDIQKLFLEVWNLKFDFKKIKFKFISRNKNKEADTLVKEAIDNPPSELLKLL